MCGLYPVKFAFKSAVSLKPKCQHRKKYVRQTHQFLIISIEDRCYTHVDRLYVVQLTNQQTVPTYGFQKKLPA